ncbi:MAG: DUF1822 family protein [Cyanobacteria bacterium P01_A01_bin.116]
MTFTFAEPAQLWLELSPTLQARAWERSQAISVAGGRWQVYINQLCLQAFLSWLQDETITPRTVFPAISALASSWELVTGTSISIGDTKLVLIPTDELGHDELQVPQEWVDIPSWAADYYIAVKINAEEGWSELWGYTTHQQLKEEGTYDAVERTMGLTAEKLSRNINVLWATIDYCPTAQTRAAIQPLSEVASPQADNLIQRLAQANTTFPRLSVPFAQWGALLNHPRWRGQLYQQRLVALQPEASTLQSIIHPINHLSAWLRGVQASVNNAIAPQQWQPAQLTLRQPGQQPESALTQAKTLQLNAAGTEISVKLIVACQVEEDNRLTINVELHPDQDDACLVENMVLSLVSQEGETLQSTQSRAADLYIRLKQFKCPIEYEFNVVVSFESDQHIEKFRA